MSDFDEGKLVKTVGNTPRRVGCDKDNDSRILHIGTRWPPLVSGRYLVLRTYFRLLGAFSILIIMNRGWFRS